MPWVSDRQMEGNVLILAAGTDRNLHDDGMIGQDLPVTLAYL